MIKEKTTVKADIKIKVKGGVAKPRPIIIKNKNKVGE